MNTDTIKYFNRKLALYVVKISHFLNICSFLNNNSRCCRSWWERGEGTLRNKHLTFSHSRPFLYTSQSLFFTGEGVELFKLSHRIRGDVLMERER